MTVRLATTIRNIEKNVSLIMTIASDPFHPDVKENQNSLIRKDRISPS
jgi:hypothetical protein